MPSEGSGFWNGILTPAKAEALFLEPVSRHFKPAAAGSPGHIMRRQPMGIGLNAVSKEESKRRIQTGSPPSPG